MNGVEIGAGDVDASENQVGSHVALVPEEVLLQHPVGNAGPDLASGVESVKLELGCDHVGRLVAVGRSSSASATKSKRQLSLIKW